jgi:hypothetical protein
MNRPSKMFSVISEAPSLTDARPIAIGSRSVAKPGYGRVTTSTASGRRSIWTRNAACPRVSTIAPTLTSFSRAISSQAASAPVTVTSPRVIAAPNAHVPATIRSPTVACRTGRSPSTPSTCSVGVPAPVIRAPIALSISQMSTISGSRAALSISVTPLASTAAISRFSVAPTLGKSSQIVAPRSPPGALAMTKPCSPPISAPICSSPAMCMSRPREPIASPPGCATRT